VYVSVRWDIVKPKRKICKKVKRKRGAQKGHKKNVRKPFTSEQVDETIEYELMAADAEGLIPLDQWYSVQQVSLPKKLYCVTEHKSRKYMDPITGKIHIASLPEEVRQGGLLAADKTTTVAYMKGNCHMSFSTIQFFFKEVIGF
jgi:hypothetical protein